MAKMSATATRLVVGVVVLAIVAVGAYFAFFQGGSTKSVSARFASAIGVYNGTPVRILGVNVGSVTGVHPDGAYVTVTMDYDSKYKLSPDAAAVEVANSLVSDRYIQLTPLYNEGRDHGRVLPSGAVIDQNHTSGPAELDDIYAALNKLAVALGPNGANSSQGGQSGALNTLLGVAAANLKGNGTALGDSITKLSQAAQTLANQREDLFGTVRNLQHFTSALNNSDAQIRLFNQQLAQVASDLASERGDLGAALHQLGLALDDVSTFIRQNAAKFHTDIRGLANILGILVRQKASLNETLAVAPVALANVVHLYQPDIGALGTRSNLASFSSTNGNSPTTIICTLISKLTNITLPGACQTQGTNSNLGGLLPGLNNTPGVSTPGLIGAG